MASRTKTTDPILHVRYNGCSMDLLLSDLDLLSDLNIGPYSEDHTVRGAVADYLGIKISKLQNHVLDRHPNGNLTLRPRAVFG